MPPDSFVLSSSQFDTIKDAENKVNGWMQSGNLDHPIKKIKLYKAIETYDLHLKFVKRKKKK